MNTSIWQDPWHGPSKIVVGIDIGTTCSGVAFTYLPPGHKPTLHRVTHWPGQQCPQSKVPSLIWYDPDGQPTSFGAEAQTPQAEENAEDCGWQLARYFKLHLHPVDFCQKYNVKLAPLPTGVPLSQVFSDFLRYLLEHTRSYFETRILDGPRIWQQHYQDLEVVIGHPNGYGIREQRFLRSAVVAAGFVTSDEAARHIRFVTEAEASVYSCLHFTNLQSRLHAGMNIAVCDAGGSTVDTTVYAVRDTSPRLQLDEVRASACVQAGAVFVDKQAESYLQHLFANVGLMPDEISEYVVTGTKDFEAQAKRAFHEPTEAHRIQIAGGRYNLPSLRIRRGTLTLEGSIIQTFFDQCVDEIITSVNSQFSGASVPHILLVGGFGGSPYLRKQLKARFEPKTQVTTLDEGGAGAVAEGAVMWCCVNSVITRAPRLSFGTEVHVPFDPTITEHGGRAQVDRLSGVHVRGRWFQLIQKDMPVAADYVTRQTHTREYSRPDLDLGCLDQELYSHSLDSCPGWLKTKSGELLDGFREVCSLTADLDSMRNALQPRINAHGIQYWALMFNVCFRFGGTELEAFLEWIEADTIRTRPVIIIPCGMVASRYTYGIEVNVPFDRTNAEHRERLQTEKPEESHVNGKWLPLAFKGVPIERDAIIRQIYTREYSSPNPELGTLNEELYTCSLDDCPHWLRDKSGCLLNGFKRISSMTADLDTMQGALLARISARGGKCWALVFNLCFRFSYMEVKASLEWVENGEIRTRPVTIIPCDLD